MQDQGLDPTLDAWSRATNVLVNGLWTPSGGVVEHPGGAFPLLADRGEGCRLIDSRGRAYVDWIMGMGPLLLGYGHEAIERAARDHAGSGPIASLLHPLEIETAELLRDLFPIARRVVFGRNGSDVLTLAVRVARALTGREVVLTHGYHGFHDWFLASDTSVDGVPQRLRELVHPFPYNDLDALRTLFARFDSRVAAVVMEPINVAQPDAGFLEGVRALADEHGALLVFDENVTAFRLANGGACEALGVRPDLSCIGKTLGNGMGITALIVTEAVEALAARVGAPNLGYGIRADSYSCAVARACMEVYRDQPVAAHVAKIGAALRDGFDAAARRHGVPAQLLGFPARTTLSIRAPAPLTELGLRALFMQECVKRGVLTNGSFLPSWAHDDEAVQASVEAFDAALAVLARAIDRETLDGLLQVPESAALV